MDEIDLKSILGLIRRQLWLIFSTIATILVVTLIFTYSLTPRYTAESLVFVDTSTKNLLNSGSTLANPNADNFRVESEVAILNSDSVLLNVVRDNGLVSDSEFGIKVSMKDRILSLLRIPLPAPPTGEQALAKVLNSFKSSVKVSREGLTYLIGVGVTSTDPAKAAKLANSLSEVYIKEQLNAKVQSTLTNRDTIQKQVETADAAIVASENEFDSYITKNIERLEKQSNAVGLTNLKAELLKINNDRLAELGRVNTLQASLQAQDFSALVSELGSQALAELQSQREDLAKRIASTTSDTPEAINLRAELAKVDTSLASAATQEVNTLQQTVSGYAQQADDVRQKIRTTVLQSNLPTEVLTKIFSIQKSSEIAREQYQTLLSRQKELDSQASLQLPDSRVVSAALVPTSASFPNNKIILGISLLIAIGLGVGLAVLREYFIGGFISENQIEAVLKVPLSAIAPRQTTGDEHHKLANPTSSLADLMVTAPLSLFSESVRRLRLTLDQQERKRTMPKSHDPDEGAIIMVSSALPNEGKSTMALSLARAYALTGKRTLLIDCDLRKPSVNKQLNLEPNHDFIDYLRQDRNSATLTSLIMRDPLSNLTVLLGGRRSDIATDELVMSEKMGRILSSARKHFDYVILDTPPVEPVVDGLYLARHADMIVFVIKWASTPQSSAKRAVAALKENKSPDAGIVTLLNQQDRAKMSGNYSYSGYYTE
ncbi:MAG TPA: Wzz/FepE/Etk N-terminal domain-containing protein [Pararhizobium sp.]|uniref:GumC family protein n=1 Tax=Pararhizobium sp. TaxID=1977563 RepID=UPI002C7D4779|nr:Wzz/FepE/Etk N-terminal domain-containing protein [Pararhizobium sp.]HTO29656.1 Wzz/FepE/Etk N-terminal domain-containing protein [Pararhizobium sp.]